MTLIAENVPAGRSRRTLLVLLLAAGLAILSVAMSPAGSLANGRKGSADVTFTKWVVTLPTDSTTLAGVLMTGVVGGDVGPGSYAGVVLGDDTTSMPGFWLGHATYEFHGSDHTFIADLHITEDDRDPSHITARIRGVVTSGWLEGARVRGRYQQWDVCPIPTPGNVFGTICFQGRLHLDPARH